MTTCATHPVRDRVVPVVCIHQLILQKVKEETDHTFWPIRSAESHDYITTRLKTKFGESSFSHVLTSWNSLPADLRSISDCSRFKSKLKTYLFQLAFNIQ